MSRWILAIVVSVAAVLQAAAQDIVPDRRLVVTRDVDFYGGDLQALFDTDLAACQRLCLNDPQCGAFTFNTRSNACFPKTGVTDRQPYDGAVSAIVIATDDAIRARAATRRADLDLPDSDIVRARDAALAIGPRHAGGQWTVATLQDAAQAARADGNLDTAIHWTGAALAQSDDAALWLQYAQWQAEEAATLRGSDRRRMTDRALLAAINAYLRSGPDAQRVDALLVLADMLEAQGRGRDMIAPLRLAETLQPRPEVSAALVQAIGQYGFRITDTQVLADSARPQICAVFSEPLQPGGVDYGDYVRRPDARLAVTVQDRRLCVTGVQHGERYRLTFRAGLPSETGETLLRDVTVTQYVRDRAPALRFPGRAYVLPRSAEAGLPLESVNADRADLVLRRVSDRNLLRTMQDGLFGRPLAPWQFDRFDAEIAEEVWRGSAPLDSDLNRDRLTRLPIGPVVADMAPGIYALTARLPGPEGADSAATQWFVLSDLGLTTLQGSDGLTVFARSLGTAAPLDDVAVTLVSSSNRELGTARTDAQGVARFAPGLLRGTGGAAPALIVARQGDADITFLSLTDPAFDLSDRGVAGREPAGPLDAFLATDRGAYRAGEVIHATALLRDAQAQAVPGVPVTAILTRPDGVEHARHVSAQDSAGGHVFALPVSDSAPRGTWRLDLHADPDAPPLASTDLLVEDFVPERIDIALALPDGAISPLAPPLMDVQVDYLFGAPGADLPVTGEVRLQAVNTLPGFPRWHFGRHDDGTLIRTEALPPDLFTDADGALQLPVPLPDMDAQGRPMQATIRLRVTEGSGRPVERAVTRPVVAPAPMIGVRPAFDGAVPQGGEARFALQAIGPDLSPVAMQADWRIDRVTTRYQWYEYDGRWQWEPVTTRDTVATGTAALGDAPIEIAAPVDWGRYEIVVDRTDGAYVSVSMGFDAGWYAPASTVDTPDMLEMSLDAAAYAPGDTATLRMVPRHAGQALVTVLSDRVIAMQAVDVTEGENTLTLPVTQDWGAGVYVTAQVIRPMDVAAGRNPARSLGLAHAAVAPGERLLDVTIEAPDQAAPRGVLDLAVAVEGAAPGQTAFVTVAAVDQGILNLTGFQPPDPAGHYFGQRRLGVEIRDLYGRLIDGMTGTMGTIRSGGDAAGGMRLQSPPPTEALMARFSGPVAVGEDGRARVSLDLPDFNGTVRVMAVAWSPTGVGQADAQVLVRDPVVISANMPRFLAPGDESRLGLDLTHASGPAGDMAVQVTAQGVTLGAAPDSVTLAQGETVRLTLPLSADTIGDHRITVALTTPDGRRLTRTLTLGVRATDPVQSATQRLTLAPGQTYTLDEALLTQYRPGTGQVLLSGGALARLDVPGMMESLGRYPYGCTEQIASQTLPLLSLAPLAGPLGLGDADAIAAQIDRGIARILTRQSANGAFGLWQAGSGEGWLDAYVTDLLTRARAQGHDVPDPALQAALDNLANRIAYAADFDRGGEDIAYALHVLAREGRAAMGDLRYYADEKADAFGTPLALAQLGAALATYGDQPRADRLFALAARRLAGAGDSRSWRADFGSPLRDAAATVTLARAARSRAVDADRLLDRIAGADRRLSTQEQAWALMAARALVDDPGMQLSVDGVPVTGPLLRRLDGDALIPLQIGNAGAVPVPLTLTTLGVPQGATQARGTGYAIDRSYYSTDGAPVDPAQVAQGTRLVTVLTVRPAQDMRARLIVDDPLPAGFEIDNPGLIRAGDIRGLDWLQTDTPETAEFRTERFVAAIDQRNADPIRLAYIVRAVSPGRFHHPAALVEDMYRPDFRATTASGTVTVTQ